MTTLGLTGAWKHTLVLDEVQFMSIQLCLQTLQQSTEWNAIKMTAIVGNGLCASGYHAPSISICERTLLRSMKEGGHLEWLKGAYWICQVLPAAGFSTSNGDGHSFCGGLFAQPCHLCSPPQAAPAPGAVSVGSCRALTRSLGTFISRFPSKHSYVPCSTMQRSVLAVWMCTLYKAKQHPLMRISMSDS